MSGGLARRYAKAGTTKAPPAAKGKSGLAIPKPKGKSKARVTPVTHKPGNAGSTKRVTPVTPRDMDDIESPPTDALLRSGIVKRASTLPSPVDPPKPGPSRAEVAALVAAIDAHETRLAALEGLIKEQGDVLEAMATKLTARVEELERSLDALLDQPLFPTLPSLQPSVYAENPSTALLADAGSELKIAEFGNSIPHTGPSPLMQPTAKLVELREQADKLAAGAFTPPKPAKPKKSRAAYMRERRAKQKAGE